MKSRYAVALILLFFIYALSASFGHRAEFCAGQAPQLAQCSNFACTDQPTREAADLCAADLDEYSATAAPKCVLATPSAYSLRTAILPPNVINCAQIEILPPVPIAA